LVHSVHARKGNRSGTTNGKRCQVIVLMKVI
jgi:hypothetical protein